MEIVALKVDIEELDDDELKDGDESEHKPKDVVGEESREKIKLIVDLAAVEEVKDLQENEHVEDKGEVS